MIISGYQGIGKSTLSSSDLRYIDLESSNFFVNGKRNENWHIPYCQIAESLSRQGYIVFVSSHDTVREYLSHSSEEFIVIVPAVELKDEWIEKLQKRYEETGLQKDLRSYQYAAVWYVESVVDLMSTKNAKIITIHDMDYSLKNLIPSMVLHKCPYVIRNAYPRCIWLNQDDKTCRRIEGCCG